MKTEIMNNSGLVGFSDIKKEPIKGWEEFFLEGRQFLTTASKAYAAKRKAFTTGILYNLVAMSIEKMIMAMLMKSGNLPYNHTMHDLVESMEEFMPGRLENLGEELKRLDAFQEICDQDEYIIKTPTLIEVKRMLNLADRMESLTMEQVM